MENVRLELSVLYCFGRNCFLIERSRASAQLIYRSSIPPVRIFSVGAPSNLHSASFRLPIQLACLARLSRVYYTSCMKTLTVRLPEQLVAEIDAESRERQLSKSDIVRERLQGGRRVARRQPSPLDAIKDLIGAVDGLPSDLSARKKHYLKATNYGRKRSR